MGREAISRLTIPDPGPVPSAGDTSLGPLSSSRVAVGESAEVFGYVDARDQVVTEDPPVVGVLVVRPPAPSHPDHLPDQRQLQSFGLAASVPVAVSIALGTDRARAERGVVRAMFVSYHVRHGELPFSASDNWRVSVGRSAAVRYSFACCRHSGKVWSPIRREHWKSNAPTRSATGQNPWSYG